MRQLFAALVAGLVGIAPACAQDWHATSQLLQAALAGHGLAYVPEGMVEAHLTKGRLKRVLAEWCEPYSGYHLYYPSRRQSSAAFALVVEALRYRPAKQGASS